MVFLLSLLTVAQPEPLVLYRPGLLLQPGVPKQRIALAYTGGEHGTGGNMYHSGMAGAHYWISGQIGFHSFGNHAAGGQLYQADFQLSYRYKKQPEQGMLRTFWTAGMQVSSFSYQSRTLRSWQISGNQFVPYLATGIMLHKGIFKLQAGLSGGVKRVGGAVLKQLNPDYTFEDFGFTPGLWQLHLAPAAALFVGREQIQGFIRAGMLRSIGNQAWQQNAGFGILFIPKETGNK